MKLIDNYFENQFLKRLRPLSDISIVVTTPELGRGVELTEGLKAGTLLGIYPGKKISIKEFLEKEEFINKSAKSAYLHDDRDIIDPTDIFGFVPDRPELRIALINEAPKDEQVNTIAVSSSQHIWYLTISDLRKGQQLYTNYGEFYEREYQASKLSLDDEQLYCLRLTAEKYKWLKTGLIGFIKDL